MSAGHVGCEESKGRDAKDPEYLRAGGNGDWGLSFTRCRKSVRDSEITMAPEESGGKEGWPGWTWVGCASKPSVSLGVDLGPGELGLGVLSLGRGPQRAKIWAWESLGKEKQLSAAVWRLLGF